MANATEYDDHWVDPFALTVNRNILVRDLKRKIVEHTQDTWTPMDPSKDIKLIMGSQPLNDTDAVGEYKEVKRAEKLWPRPYAGQILITKDQPAPMHMPEEHKYR